MNTAVEPSNVTEDPSLEDADIKAATQIQVGGPTDDLAEVETRRRLRPGEEQGMKLSAQKD